MDIQTVRKFMQKYRDESPRNLQIIGINIPKNSRFRISPETKTLPSATN